MVYDFPRRIVFSRQDTCIWQDMILLMIRRFFLRRVWIPALRWRMPGTRLKQARQEPCLGSQAKRRYAMALIPVYAFIIIIVIFFLASAIKVLKEYERGVIFRLGRVLGTPKGPGLILLIPIVDKMVKVSLRTVVLDIPPQDVITRDNVTIKVNAVVFFRVLDSLKAIIDVENYLYATSQLSQTTLRSVLGQAELDDLLSHREKINERLQEILDTHTESWGIKVSNVEVKNVDLPQEMQRAISRQAEAERERRAKIIGAEGEFQASTKLAEASDILSVNPMALQLRYLQTLIEIATEKNSTIVFPLPIDLIKMFMDRMKPVTPEGGQGTGTNNAKEG
jgi:regulator of protease activity HflC (stomatin/prohibitin superfamily)